MKHLKKSNSPARGYSVRPLTDIVETEKELKLISEIPGIPKESVSIDLEGRVLGIKAGMNKEEKTETGYSFLSRSYERKFRIPEGFDTDKISADLNDGRLTLVIPKEAVNSPRQISVN